MHQQTDDAPQPLPERAVVVLGKTSHTPIEKRSTDLPERPANRRECTRHPVRRLVWRRNATRTCLYALARQVPGQAPVSGIEISSAITHPACAAACMHASDTCRRALHDLQCSGYTCHCSWREIANSIALADRRGHACEHAPYAHRLESCGARGLQRSVSRWHL